MTRAPIDAFRVLCVCTGNVFRSRIAEHCLRSELANRLGADAGAFEVRSAGAGVVEGRPIHPGESAALVRCGMPADDRPAHRLTAADIAAADLVLCADRSHVAAVLELVPGAHRRTFGLREFARATGPALRPAAAGRTAASNGVEPDPVTRARTAVAHAAAFRGYVPAVADDEIPDPWGRPDEILDVAADLVRSAVPGVVEALTGTSRLSEPRESTGTASASRVAP